MPIRRTGQARRLRCEPGLPSGRRFRPDPVRAALSVVLAQELAQPGERPGVDHVAGAEPAALRLAIP
ncbi:MAG: hypothetical protein ACLP7J_19950 [Streptosporangiaceae bacterium]